MQIRERNRSYSLILAALTFVSALLFCRGLASPAVRDADTHKPWNRLVAIGAQFKPAAAGTRIACVPVIVPGRSVFVTTITSRNKPATDVSVMVNGMPVNTDLEGLAVFTAPDSGGLTLSLMDASHKVLFERKYVLSGGKLVAQPLSGSLINRLLDSSPAPNANSPSMIYAPLVTSPGLELMIIGHNFSANPEDVQVILDGVSIPVISSSPVSCLCVVPNRTGIGPLKEIFVKIGDDPSTAREVDVANAELIYRETTLLPGTIYHGRIQVIGTNFPCLLEVENRFPQLVNLSLPGGSALSHVVSILTPGGERNLVPIDIQVKEPVPFLVDVRVLPNLPGASGSEDYASDINYVSLVRQTNLGDITRLKRRLIAIDKRLATLKNTTSVPGDSAQQRRDKQEKSLKERRGRLNSMLNHERQLFMSLGGTDNDYQKALDLAQVETQPAASNVQLLPLPVQPSSRPASQAQR